MPSTRRRLLTLCGLAAAGSTATLATGRDGEPDGPADWPMSRYDAAGTASHPSLAGPKDGVEVAWSRNLSGGSFNALSPIHVDGRLYVVRDGLVALSSATGETLFERDVPVGSTPARAAASVYTTDTLAVTGRDGVGGLNAGGGVDLPVLGGTVGTRRWRGPRAADPGLLGQPTVVPPVTADGTVYAAPGAEQVVALGANDGAVEWRARPTGTEYDGGQCNRPAVRDGRVFVTSYPYTAAAFDAETGSQRWARDLDEQLVLAPVATAAGVVVQTRSGVVLLDTADGTPQWRRSLETNVTEGAPAVADGRVFLADDEETLYALDLASGETLWTATVRDSGSPVVADGVVYTVESGGRIVAVDAVSGRRRFTFDLERTTVSAPVVGDGRLYLTSFDGVMALEEPA